jgi:beta-hydroxylase
MTFDVDRISGCARGAGADNATDLAAATVARFGRESMDASSQYPQTPSLNHRRHTLSLPSSPLGKLALRAQEALESTIARASIHPDVPVYDNALFPWVPAVEQATAGIRTELNQVMQFRDRLPAFHEIIKEVGTITHDANWKTFFLMGVGMDCSENARRCPDTMKAIAQIPNASTAFFSILSPGKHIPAHRGAYNGVLRLHLAVTVPEPAERCRIRVADEYRSWKEGEVLIFDDTYNHEVWNDTEGWRVVLFVDFARPLREPWNTFNRSLLKLGPLAPFLRDADRKQRKWASLFYRDA